MPWVLPGTAQLVLWPFSPKPIVMEHLVKKWGWQGQGCLSDFSPCPSSAPEVAYKPSTSTPTQGCFFWVYICITCTQKQANKTPTKQLLATEKPCKRFRNVCTPEMRWRASPSRINAVLIQAECTLWQQHNSTIWGRLCAGDGWEKTLLLTKQHHHRLTFRGSWKHEELHFIFPAQRVC